MVDKFKAMLVEASVAATLIGQGLFWMMTVLAPIKTSIGLVCFLVLGNLSFGLAAMVKEKQKFLWRRFFWSLSKFAFYPYVLALGLAMEGLMPKVPVASIFAGWIAVHEGGSIGTNFNRIYGYNIFKAVKEWLLNRNRDWTDVVTDLKEKKPNPKIPTEGE